MRLLVVNAGSSSLKLRVLQLGAGARSTATADRLDSEGDGDGDGNGNPAEAWATTPPDPLAEHDVEGWEGAADTSALATFVEGVGGVDAVAHRVVHGGELDRATLIDDAEERRLASLTDLAPLHQPRALAGLAAARTVLPDVPHAACFDTAFHRTLPPAAATYALPAAWRRRWGLHRFGFHGLSHAWVARRAAALVGRPVDELRTVSCHLGAGASLCAIDRGRSVDTTMGFTPLEGLVMNTRSGSVDPGLVLWLVTHAGLSVDEVLDGLEHRSGRAGLAGHEPGGSAGDIRRVVADLAADGPDGEAARLALAVDVHRLRREIGAAAAVLGGVDVLAFTGGVGEHQPLVRSRAVETLGFLGLAVAPERNEAARSDADVSAEGARARVLVVTAREDLEIARQVRALLLP